MLIFGIIGGFLLSICIIPEVVRTIKDKHCYINGLTLFSWFSGCLLMVVYTIYIKDIPLLINYILGSLCLGVISYYKLRKRKELK